MFDSILKFISALFYKKPTTSGYIPDSHDPRDAWHDLVFGVADPSTFAPSIDWTSKINLRRQGVWPFCVSFATAHLYNFFTKIDLSVRWLAFKSGTTYKGNSIRTVLEVLRTQGAVLESELPFDFTVDTRFWSKMMNVAGLTQQQLGNAAQRKIDGYARILQGDINTLKAALQKSPVMCAIGIGSNYSYPGVIQNPPVYGAYHCTLITGYDEQGNFRIGDSLVPQEKLLSRYYIIPWLYTVSKLPDNWKQVQQENMLTEFANNLNRYGEPKDANQETVVIDDLGRNVIPLLKQFPTAEQYLTRYWTIYVNALTYGDWVNDDVLKDIHSLDTTGHHAFNFDSPKQ